jgi:hypothetical protein
MAPFQREQGARLFYSIYSFEIFLAETTGRPKAISIENVMQFSILLPDSPEPVSSTATGGPTISTINTSQLWSNFLTTHFKSPQRMTPPLGTRWEAQNIAQTFTLKYFPCRVRLCIISHRIGSELYDGAPHSTWSAVQDKITYFETELRKWRQELPHELNSQVFSTTDHNPRPTVELAMYYHSVQMILYCRLLSGPWNREEWDTSRHFENYSGRSCVFAAMDMLALLPNDPTDQECYHLLPWWGSVHYLCQAAAVLLLELCLKAPHFRRSDTGMISRCLWKAVSYLRFLAECSLSAYKAWRTFQHLAMDICAQYDDFPTTDVTEVGDWPHGWTDLDEAHLIQALTY